MKSKRKNGKKSPIRVLLKTLIFVNIILLTVLAVKLQKNVVQLNDDDFSLPEIPQTFATPTYDLRPGETLFQVAEKLPHDFDETLRIGGGGAAFTDYVDMNGNPQTGWVFYLHPLDNGSTIDDVIAAYEGLEVDYKSYHIRALKILHGERSAVVLAISKVTE